MRPLRLEFEAFGAFPDRESVDFEALAGHGLFLVAGATGAGKSTIFDAMCWALYGEMPTKRAAEVCSDHVDDPSRCAVTFEFAIADGHYRVRRTPRYWRAKKRGTGQTEENPTALLEDLSGPHPEPVETRWTAVTDRVTELIGLGAEQFQRVILLPQGEFARFLTANTNDRRDVLSRLFGGGVYERIVDQLKARSRALARQVDDHRNRMDQHLDTAHRQLCRAETVLGAPADPDGSIPSEEATERCDERPEPDERPEDMDREALGVRFVTLGEDLTALDGRVAEARRQAARADEAWNRAKSEAERFDAAEKAREELRELDDARDAIETDWRAAERSAAARPVVTAAGQVSRAERQLTECVDGFETARSTLAGVLDEVGVAFEGEEPHRVATALDERRLEHEHDQRLLQAVRTAVDALEKANGHEQQCRKALEQTEGELKDVGRQLEQSTARRESLAAAAARVEATRSEVERLEPTVAARRSLDGLLPRLESARERFDEARAEADRLMDRFVATQAPRLAEQLTADAPCPVCGSHDHPAPAVDDHGPAVDLPAVNQAARLREKHRDAVTELEQEQRRLEETLGDHVGLSGAELDEKLTAARAAVTRAEDAGSQFDQFGEQLGRLETAREVLVERRGTQASALEDARTAVADATTALATAREEAGARTPETVDRTGTLLGSAAEHLETYRQAHEAVTGARTTLRTVTTNLEQVLAGSDFDTVDTARAALVDPDREQTALARARQHATATERVRGALQQLETQGIPDQRPDVEAAETAAGSAGAALRSVHDRFTTVTTLRGSVKDELDQFDVGSTEFGAVVAEAETVARAEVVCARGGSARHIRLPLWVLARELDRITRAANVHLAEMTGNRYTLARVAPGGAKNTITDLDLEVTDAHTGRARSTASLSGGEQFQASLALALGLADVVSQDGRTTGATFEALFVDEGFGSLDRDALDTAVATLLALRDTGRMVGAITHVESMKEELPVGIQVRARGTEPGSTLTVHI